MHNQENYFAHKLLCAFAIVAGGLFVGCGDDDSNGSVDASTTLDGGSSGSADASASDSGTTSQDASIETDAGIDPTTDAGTGACRSADDCTFCVHRTAPRTERDCRCPLCPVYPMTKAQCETNTKAYNSVCSDWLMRTRCPVPLCVAPPEPECNDQMMCTAGSPIGPRR